MNKNKTCFAQVKEDYCPEKALKGKDYCKEHNEEFGGTMTTITLSGFGDFSENPDGYKTCGVCPATSGAKTR